MEPQVRFCTSTDGTRIAYSVTGKGQTLVVCPELGESFGLLHLYPEYEHFVAELGKGRRLVRYDARGCGMSQRDPKDVSIDAFVSDLKAVIAATGLRRFDLFGSSDGGTVALAYSARHSPCPNRLVVYGAFARSAEAFDRIVSLGFATMARANWEMAASMFATGGLRSGYPEASLQMSEFVRQSTSGEMVARYIEASLDVDILPELCHVKSKTIVMHRMEDSVTAISQAQKIAAAIPKARLVPLHGGIHRAELGDSQAILSTINEFLGPSIYKGYKGQREATALPPTRPAFRTVLFTDLVGHTEMMSRLGDERGRAVLREHERVTREVLKAHGGTEVKSMGDGFMASFGSVTKAVECAIALQRAFAEWNASERAQQAAPLQVRVGLNAGEPIEEEGDLFGATVILASRIAAKADGGEILVANAVRELCTGKGFLFADRGDFVAKGFEEPVRVYEVRWRDG